MEFLWDGGTKVCPNASGHMTKMAAMTIYGNKFLLWNQKANELEQVCSNDDPELTLTYFTTRSNLVHFAIVWKKGKTMNFSETIVVCDV